MATKDPKSGLTDVWKAFGDLAPDWSKLFEAGKNPSDFWADAMERNKANIAALTKLNESIAATTRQIGERQVALFHSMMGEAGKAAEQMKAAGTKPTEAMTEAFDGMVKQMREIGEIAEKANREALAKIEERGAAFRDELKKLMDSVRPG